MEEQDQVEHTKTKAIQLNTIISNIDVKGLYVEPLEAKQTPVIKSLDWRLGFQYAGRSSLMPNSSTVLLQCKKKKKNSARIHAHVK